jgi:hypothetical protein
VKGDRQPLNREPLARERVGDPLQRREREQPGEQRGVAQDHLAQLRLARPDLPALAQLDGAVHPPAAALHLRLPHVEPAQEPAEVARLHRQLAGQRPAG